MQGCLACEYGINVSHGRKEKVLKRHEHEDDTDNRDSKRVRFTHKQPDTRAELEMTDDTVAKRATLLDTP